MSNVVEISNNGEVFTCALVDDTSNEVNVYVILKSNETGTQFRGQELTVWKEPEYGPSVGAVNIPVGNSFGALRAKADKLLADNPV